MTDENTSSLDSGDQYVVRGHRNAQRDAQYFMHSSYLVRRSRPLQQRVLRIEGSRRKIKVVRRDRY